MSEILDHRLLAVRPDRTEISCAQRLFERAARGHYLAPDRADVIVGERPFAHFLEPRDHLHLALGAKHRRIEMLLHLSHFERHGGALVRSAMSCASSASMRSRSGMSRELRSSSMRCMR